MNNSRWSNASLLRSSESRAIHCRIQLFCSVPQAHGKSFAMGHSSYWKSQFCRGLFFRHTIKVLPCANVAHGNIKHSQNLNDKNSKKIAKTLFNLKSQVTIFFEQSSRATQPVGFEPATCPCGHFPCKVCVLHGQWDSNLQPPPRALASLLLRHTLTCVYTLFSFPTYYTKLRVNCLFEALNEFKLKSCQQQNFITFSDLQLSFWLFSI